jgi:hypothetical protein
LTVKQKSTFSSIPWQDYNIENVQHLIQDYLTYKNNQKNMINSQEKKTTDVGITREFEATVVT